MRTYYRVRLSHDNVARSPEGIDCPLSRRVCLLPTSYQSLTHVAYATDSSLPYMQADFPLSHASLFPFSRSLARVSFLLTKRITIVLHKRQKDGRCISTEGRNFFLSSFLARVFPLPDVLQRGGFYVLTTWNLGFSPLA
jgi:hypothetical protein